jgi:hypothetical protein
VTGADGYRVYRSSDPSGPFTLLATVGSGATTQSTYDPSSLATGTDFHYLVRAFDASGESADSNHHTQITAPGKPSLTSAVPTGESSAFVDWNGVPGAASYVVRRAIGVTATPVQVGTTTTPTTDFSDSGLIAHTPYVYDVIAVNSGGSSVPSDGRLAQTDYACDATNNHTQATAKDIGDVTGDVSGTPIVENGVLCRGQTDWLKFDVTEGDSPSDHDFVARIDFQPGLDLNGQEEKIRGCVLDGQGNPDDDCSAYGVSTATPPPFFFTTFVSFQDLNFVDDQTFPVYVKVDGQLPASNNVYTVTVTGAP